MGVETADRTDFGRVSRLKGRVFEALSLGASVFGILMLALLLVYVVTDAFGLESASPEWLLSYFVTLVLPFLGFCLYSAGSRTLARNTALALGVGLVGAFAVFTGIETFVRSIPRLSWPLFYLFLVGVPVTTYVGFIGSRAPVGLVGFGLLGRLVGGAGFGVALFMLFGVFEPATWLWAYTVGVLPAVVVYAYSRRVVESPIPVSAGLLVVTGGAVAVYRGDPAAFGLHLLSFAPAGVFLFGTAQQTGNTRGRVLASVVLLLGGAGLGATAFRLFETVWPNTSLLGLLEVSALTTWHWTYTLLALPAVGVALYAYSYRALDAPTSVPAGLLVVTGSAVVVRPESPIALGLYLLSFAPAGLSLLRAAEQSGRRRERLLGAVGLLTGIAGLVGSRSLELTLTTVFPVRPATFGIFVWALVVPLSVVVAYLTAQRSTRRQGVATGALVFALGAGVSRAAVLVDITPSTALLYLVAIGVPTVMFISQTVEEQTGLPGLALPVVLVGGVLLGAAVVQTLGVGTPEPWLDPSFLSGTAHPLPERAGFYPAIVGSVVIIAMVAVISFVLGVGTAVFLEEYTPSGGPLATVTRVVQINIANLAAVPSVVYGLLGLGVFVNILGFGLGTAVTAAITLSLLILPITVIAAQEAIRSVPDSMRNASYAMGATRWQTTRNVVLPEAFSGILTGTILALGRAIGETAPLIMIGAPTVVFSAPDSISDKLAAMPMQIFAWSSSAKTEFQYGVLAAGVVTLLVVLISLNAAAIILRNRSERD